MPPLALWVALASGVSFADTCGTPDCPVADDLVAAMSTTPGTATAATPAPAPWSHLTSVQPGDFQDKGLDPKVLELALIAYAKAHAQGLVKNEILTVIDYGKTSDQKRLWSIDMKTGELLFHEHVAHGRGSGIKQATKFSNVTNSHQSNLGLMTTAETYYGKHGKSLKLDGHEPGFNDTARSRYIVMHSANYLKPSYIDRMGRAGTSHGCPAVRPAIAQKMIAKLKGGSVLFGYAPDAHWLEESKYLGDAGDAAAASLPPPTLEKGHQGDAVSQLQSALSRAGYYDGPIDGDFGRGTKKAVKAFQKAQGLKADGVVGPSTWEALR